MHFENKFPKFSGTYFIRHVFGAEWPFICDDCVAWKNSAAAAAAARAPLEYISAFCFRFCGITGEPQRNRFSADLHSRPRGLGHWAGVDFFAVCERWSEKMHGERCRWIFIFGEATQNLRICLTSKSWYQKRGFRLVIDTFFAFVFLLNYFCGFAVYSYTHYKYIHTKLFVFLDTKFKGQFIKQIIRPPFYFLKMTILLEICKKIA